jgi:dTDP-4-dehydrorhamnose reductase
LLEKEFWGLYNMVCDGATGRLEVAQELIKILGLEKEVKVTPVDSSFWKSEYFAERPKSERLINRKLEIRSLNVMREWRVCLKEYLSTYYQDYLK